MNCTQMPISNLSCLWNSSATWAYYCQPWHILWLGAATPAGWWRAWEQWPASLTYPPCHQPSHCLSNLADLSTQHWICRHHTELAGRLKPTEKCFCFGVPRWETNASGWCHWAHNGFPWSAERRYHCSEPRWEASVSEWPTWLEDAQRCVGIARSQSGGLSSD